MSKAHRLSFAGFLVFLLGPVFVPEAQASIIIDNLPGKRVVLCGSGDLIKTNDRLKMDPENFALDSSVNVDHQFEAGYPTGFPATYWGLNSSTDSFICVGVTSHSYVVSNPTQVFLGPTYYEFAVTIQGFMLDESGDRQDVNGDQEVDENDWTSLRYLQVFGAGGDPVSGPYPLSEKTLVLFEDLYNVRGDAGATFLSNPNAQQYMRAFEVRFGSQSYFDAEMSPANSNYCTGFTVWEQCWNWAQFGGVMYEVSTEPNSQTIPIAFSHLGNKWVKFDEEKDHFAAHDPGLQTFFDEVSFRPLFWVLSKENEWDYLN